MLENEALRGDTVIDTLVNMSSDEMREDTVVKTLANIADGEVPDDVIGALLAAFGAPESLRGETVVGTIENIVREAGVTDDVPDDFISALLMLGDVSGDTTGVNLFAVSSARDGYILSNGNYTNAVNDNHPMTCEYLAVTPGQSLVFQSWVLESPSATSTNLNLWMAYAFYDSDKKAITSRTEQRSGTLLSSGYRYNLFTLTAPEGAAYFRGCCRRVLGGYAKIEYGTEATPWTPSPQDVAVVLNEASVCSASNAYSMPPLAATIFGKSVQDGTPTPSNPVNIESIATLTAHASGDGVLVWNQIANTSTYTTHALPTGSTVVNGSKYYAAVTITITESSSKKPFLGFYTRVNGSDKSIMRLTSTSAEVGAWKVSNIYTSGYDAVSTGNASSEGSLWWYIAKQGATCSISDVMLIDLTRMFGAGNEPTAAEFEEMYPETYYAYDAGTAHDSEGWPITIDLDGHELRSLPDGTRDLLTVDINGNVTLIQQVGVAHISSFGGVTSGSARALLSDGRVDIPALQSTCLCDKLANTPLGTTAFSKLTYVIKACRISSTNTKMNAFVNFGGTEETLEDFNATLTAIGGFDVAYPLETPVIHTLDPIPLPALPAPKFNAWADTDVPTTLTMRYLQA